MQEHALIEKEFSIYYNVSGSGEPVVLLHGFGEDYRIWDSIAQELQKEYKVIVPDFVGSGRSKGNTDGLSMDTLAEHTDLILQKENIISCFMIGHSMGGYATLAFAEKFPDKLKGLGLFHSTAFPDSEEKKEARKKNVEFIKKHGSEVFIEQSTPNLFSQEFREKYPGKVREIIQQYSDFSPISLVAYTEAMMNRPDRTEVLKKIPKPVLLIIGEFDTAIPIDQSMKLCKLAEFAYIYIAAHSGHMGMLEEPEFCLKAIQDFLSGR